ncbi:probable ribonuclease P/MRP protein subunit POP5 [Phaseolus vulgaris]|uniref:probable ribonuclease P/MRP protein subunit POP5 n=1 Tax=Phaseolus vulgaris TaxID=3885 RepID=UPI0035CB00E5
MVGFRNRYMVMEVFVNPNRDKVGNDSIIITQFNVSKAVKDSLLENFGECGLASSLGSFQVKYVNSITNVCIIRVSREDYQKVWSAITMVTNIANCPVMFNLLDLSEKKCIERLAPWKDFITLEGLLCDHTINKLVQISI